MINLRLPNQGIFWRFDNTFKKCKKNEDNNWTSQYFGQGMGTAKQEIERGTKKTEEELD